MTTAWLDVVDISQKYLATKVIDWWSEPKKKLLTLGQ
jgi:hypothetical protein